MRWRSSEPVSWAGGLWGGVAARAADQEEEGGMRQPRFGLPVAVTIVLMALTYVPGAQAAARFSCRASAVRAVFTSPSSTLEPTVSSRTPCADVQATN